MAMKEWVRRFQPLPLYFIFGLTVAFFFVQLVVSHVTHALTLLVDSYHALCNMIALVGSIITIKYGSGRTERQSSTPSSATENEELKSLASLPHQPKMCSLHPLRERHLRNTFGWARVDVLVMLIGCVFLASLCFSLLVEALQTLIHISHHDEMHHPIPVMCLGIVGILINILCYVLIGGYTFHQGSFLNSGDENYNSEIESGVTKSQPELTKPVSPDAISKPKRQGIWQVFRDIVGCLFVIVCAVMVYYSDRNVAKYIDPVLSMLSALFLLILSYPYMKESCLILLQTIPDHINIDSLCSQLLKAFPDIINVHELHVWRLTVGKTYSTAHIIFLNPQEYTRITKDLTAFFHSQGITHVTIQPEFFKDVNSMELVSRYELGHCLVQCNGGTCLESHCCTSNPSLESVSVDCFKKHKTPKSSPKQVEEKITQVAALEIVKDEETETFKEVITQVTETVIVNEGAKVISVTKEVQEEVTDVSGNLEAVAELETVSELEDAISENSL